MGRTDVLLPPGSDAGWGELEAAIATANAQGIDVYRATCSRAFEVLAAARQGKALRVISLHDTMNTKCRPDGAITVTRPPCDELPPWVNFGNCGDTAGAGDPAELTLSTKTILRVRRAWAQALGVAAEEETAMSLNVPYPGGYESRFFGAMMRGDAAVHRGPHSGSFQVEFLREKLLGAAATAHVQAPGQDWPEPDMAHLKDIAGKLAAAGAALRAADTGPE